MENNSYGIQNRKYTPYDNFIKGRSKSPSKGILHPGTLKKLKEENSLVFNQKYDNIFAHKKFSLPQNNRSISTNNSKQVENPDYVLKTDPAIVNELFVMRKHSD